MEKCDLIKKFLEAYVTGSDERVHHSKESHAKEFLDNAINCFSTQFAFSYDILNFHIENACGLESTLGYKDDELSIEKFYELIHPEDCFKIMETIAEAQVHLLEHNETAPLQSQLSMTHRMKHASGHYIHVQHLVVIVATDEDENILKTFTLCTDLSQIPFKRVTAELKCSCNGFVTGFKSLENEFETRYKEILSKRELEVLYLIKGNKSSADIAIILSISKYTVDKHRASILKKAGANNTQEVVSLID